MCLGSAPGPQRLSSPAAPSARRAQDSRQDADATITPPGPLCDNLVSLRKVQLTRLVGSLARSKVEELDRALKMALALE